MIVSLSNVGANINQLMTKDGSCSLIHASLSAKYVFRNYPGK